MPDADSGEVYTWGWKECVPSGKVFGDLSAGKSTEKEVLERQSSFLTEQGSFNLQSKNKKEKGFVFSFRLMYWWVWHCYS